MIRHYKDSDFEVIEKIYNLSKADEFASEVFDVEVIPLAKDKSMLSMFHESEIFIYDKDGKHGFFGIKGKSISWLFVHPSSRGKNVGKELVLYALSRLEGQATLNVARSNSTAMNLYKNIGFKVLREFFSNYQGHSVVVCEMGIEVKNG